jgi:acetyl esterase/lipase
VTVFQQLEDIYAAMNHIDGMMPQLKAELGHCYMVGDSAGAMLAMYASAIQRNPRLAKAAGVRPSYLEIMSLALISGMFYTTRMDKIGLVMPKAFYGDHYKKHPFYPYLNPDNIAVSMYLPPCMLITSKADHLRNYTYALAAAIRHNRAPCILRDYGRDPNLYHAFSVFDPELPESWKVIEDIASFFNEYE